MKLDPSIKIETQPCVYAPAEDTYLLLSAVKVRKGQRVLEMGCGTGIIALHCVKAGCRVTAADISADAVECTWHNADLNGLDLELAMSDLFEKIEGKFDVIIFNPPYLMASGSEKITNKDALPLIGGEEGHEITVRFLGQAEPHLEPGGKIYLLTSSESGEQALQAAQLHFSIRPISEKHIFFEVLAVHELELEKP